MRDAQAPLLVIVLTLLASFDVAAATPCDETYAENAFRVCWFRGSDSATGQFLGTEFDANLPAPVPVSTFGIDHDWGDGPVFAGISPGAGGNEDDISGVWRGRLLFEAGRYQFTTFVSDGVRVFVDEQLLIDEYHVERDIRYGGVVDLTAGYHDVRVEWFGSTATTPITRLRLHWNRVPVPAGEKISPVVVDVFLLKTQRVCFGGHGWVSGNAVNVYGPGHVVHAAFQIEDPLGLPRAFHPGDPALATLPLVECMQLTMTADELSDAKKEVERFRARMVNWSGGTLDPTVRFFELEGDVNSTLIGSGWWVGPWDVRHLAEPSMTSESDFAMVLSPTVDHSTGRFVDIPFCGGTFGNDYGMGGAGYSWVPDSRSHGFQCLAVGALIHEWLHQFTYAVRHLHGYYSIYPDDDQFPGRGYPPCGQGNPDTFSWFPDSHDWGTDPDTPWCDGPEADVGISEMHTLSHFDGSLGHYPLGFVTGNHCNDRLQDFGEYAVDQGSNCPVPVFHQVQAAPHGLGQIAIDPPAGPYPHGSRVSLFATPADGCYFDGWTGAFSSFDNPLEVTVTSDLQFFAEFACPGLGETLVLGAVEDGWVRRGHGGNYGADSHLKIQRDDKDVFVKFALPGPGIVLSATLTAVASLSKAGTVDVHAVVGGGWQEETLEGANAPPIGTLLGSATATGHEGQVLTWDVTDAVAQAAGAGAASMSVALRMTTGNQVYLASKEHPRWAPPTLVIKWLPAAVDEIGVAEDTWVDIRKAGPHGADNHLKVQRTTKVMYLKFPLAGMSGATGAMLTAVTSLEKAGTVHVHAVADTGWDEDTVQGPGGPPIGDWLDSATAGGAAGEQLRWSVSAAVAQALAAGDEAVAFALVMTEGDQVYFWSKESGREAPRLIVAK